MCLSTEAVHQSATGMSGDMAVRQRRELKGAHGGDVFEPGEDKREDAPRDRDDASGAADYCGCEVRQRVSGGGLQRDLAECAEGCELERISAVAGALGLLRCDCEALVVVDRTTNSSDA